jgi:hypothetical protein
MNCAAKRTENMSLLAPNSSKDALRLQCNGRRINPKLLIPSSAVNGVKYYMGLVGENPTRVGKNLTRKSETIFDRCSVLKKIRANESRGRKESQEGALSRFRLSPE